VTRILCIRNAEVAGRPGLDVRLRDGRIDSVGEALAARSREASLDARGGALLPGLRDHHIHLMALAAARRSLPCGPPQVRDTDALRGMLESARPDGTGWIRGVGYHDSVAGSLDRAALDAWRPDVPVRIQHRSGALWILNGAALEALDLTRSATADLPGGVERDGSGQLTGRIYRLDAWLRERLPHDGPPPLGPIGAELARVGVTGVTDATAANGREALARLVEAVESGELPQRLRVMGSATLPELEHPRVTRGQRKIMLHESALPELDSLTREVRDAHTAGRGVAFHCVTRSEAVLAAAALAAAGGEPSDRIEHASIAPPDLLELLAGLPLAIVSQPNFIRERGDSYMTDVDARDQPWLYRARGFLDAGLPLAGGTDAPFGDPDPWRAMRAAVDRRSECGAVLGASEALSPEQALALFTSPLDAPGRGPAPVAPGAPADLCLLDRSWSEARATLDAGLVRATLVAGQPIWLADGAEVSR
jgi:predicted amidohydrolase YtcJ